MNVFAHVEARVLAALEDMRKAGDLPSQLVLPQITAEAPRDPSHGDVATNAAMVLAKPASMKPREIAEHLKTRLETGDDVTRVDIAGPGFLNLTFGPAFWQRLVGVILERGPDFGRATVGGGIPTNVEYVSANPTGPMHVGHCRGAVFGDALANLLAFAGFAVTREYYVNDAGGQVDVLARSAFLRYREALGEAIGPIPEGLYPGEYLKPVGASLVAAHGNALLGLDEHEWLPFARDAAITMMLVEIKADLEALNIRHDVFVSEASLAQGDADQIEAAIRALQDKGLIYEGLLPRPKGHEDEEWEEREQTLFRSTQFGDDVDRALKKSDGTYTYFAGDIAYHYNKLQRGFRHLINVFGADHIGYIPRMKAAVAALSDGKADFDIKVCQLVKLFRAGEPVRMSKRSGNFVTLREVIDEVGRDSVRFMMLMRKNDAALDFDLAKVIEQSKDNPVFYVQYAHARTHSALRAAAEIFNDLPREALDYCNAPVDRLTDDGELGLIKLLAAFPATVAGAARAHEPHRLAFYLYEVASAFHGQWARGNESPHLRYIQSSDRELTVARMALVLACQQVLSSGLNVLGVQAPTSMR